MSGQPAAVRDPGTPPGSDEAPLLRVSGLGKAYGRGPEAVRAVGNVDFALRAGEFVSIVGPSGCGKTTLLSCIAGLLPPTTGAVCFRSARVTGPPEGVSVVFQDYSRSLFPWLTVEKNIAVPLRGSRIPRRQVRAQVADLLTRVGLDPAVAGRFPWQLSGGMQQRVAIARALISRPELLIMDEPFASVDAQTRMTLEDLVLTLRGSMVRTVLFVTHDIDEAVYLSDRILVLSKSPSEIVADLTVPLAQPRDQISSKQDPAFGELRAKVLALVMGQ